METVQIRVAGGDTETVSGQKFGEYLLVHPSINYRSRKGRLQRYGCTPYAVTHLPTGCFIVDNLDRVEACAIASALAGSGLDLSPSEAGELAPLREQVLRIMQEALNALPLRGGAGRYASTVPPPTADRAASE